MGGSIRAALDDLGVYRVGLHVRESPSMLLPLLFLLTLFRV